MSGGIKVSENRPPAPLEQRNEILDRVRKKGQSSDSLHAVERDNSVFPHCVFGALTPVSGHPHAAGIYHKRVHMWVEQREVRVSQEEDICVYEGQLGTHTSSGVPRGR